MWESDSNEESEHLTLLLAEGDTPDDAAIRLVVDGDGFGLKIDTPQPGDTTFEHEEKVVLAIDGQVSELVADQRLDVGTTGDENKLKLIEQLEE